MNYEKFVNQVLDLREEIERQQEKVLDLETRCNSCTAQIKERVQGTVKNSREINLALLTDAQNELDVMYQQLEDISDSLTSFFTKHLKRQDATIMIYKYVYGKKNDEIANMKRLAEGTVRNIIWRSNIMCEKRFK